MLLSVRELELRKVDFDVVVPPGKLCLPGTRFRQLEAIRIGGVAEFVNASEEIRRSEEHTSELQSH